MVFLIFFDAAQAFLFFFPPLNFMMYVFFPVLFFLRNERGKSGKTIFSNNIVLIEYNGAPGCFTHQCPACTLNRFAAGYSAWKSKTKTNHNIRHGRRKSRLDIDKGRQCRRGEGGKHRKGITVSPRRNAQRWNTTHTINKRINSRAPRVIIVSLLACDFSRGAHSSNRPATYRPALHDC